LATATQLLFQLFKVQAFSDTGTDRSIADVLAVAQGPLSRLAQAAGPPAGRSLAPQPAAQLLVGAAFEPHSDHPDCP